MAIPGYKVPADSTHFLFPLSSCYSQAHKPTNIYSVPILLHHHNLNAIT